jgi:hypothetical protein
MTIDAGLLNNLPKDLRRAIRQLEADIAALGGGGGGGGAVELIESGTFSGATWSSPVLTDYAAVMYAFDVAPGPMFLLISSDGSTPADDSHGCSLRDGVGVFHPLCGGFSGSFGTDLPAFTRIGGDAFDGEQYWLYGIRKDAQVASNDAPGAPMWQKVSSGTLSGADEIITVPTGYEVFQLYALPEFGGDAGFCIVQVSQDGGSTWDWDSLESGWQTAEGYPSRPLVIFPGNTGTEAKVQNPNGSLTSLGANDGRINRIRLTPASWPVETPVVGTFTGTWALYGIPNP